MLRYFVMREIVFYGLDGDFSEEKLTARYNADLANDLGNLVSRVLSMAQRYLQGRGRRGASVDDDSSAHRTAEHSLSVGPGEVDSRTRAACSSHRSLADLGRR